MGDQRQSRQRRRHRNRHGDPDYHFWKGWWIGLACGAVSVMAGVLVVARKVIEPMMGETG